ncbi:MAG: hypothetical protein B7X93_10345 [Hydrogenophilales bacterium 17-61-9]|nr:MAG: hypothetical protein B7X93_10345 [Hydrogenophilales bacterium 17-61-9]
MNCLHPSGGAGYIGSHTAVACLAAEHEVVVVDNLSNSSPVSLARVSRIAGLGRPGSRQANPYEWPLMSSASSQ